MNRHPTWLRHNCCIKNRDFQIRPLDLNQINTQKSPTIVVIRLCILFILLFLPKSLIDNTEGLLITTTLTAIQLLLIVAIIFGESNRTLVNWRIHWKDGRDAIIIAAGMIALIAFTGSLIDLLPHDTRIILLRGAHWQLTDVSQLPLVFTFVLVGSYREELYFRVYFLSMLKEIETPSWLALLISALLFTLGHLYQGWTAAIIAFLIGISFGILYQIRPSLHRIAWAHAIFNTVILIYTLFH